MKSTLLILLVFQLFMVCSIYSQINIEEDNSTKVFIKPNENEIATRIIAVASYGLILENKKTVSYKVISKIITDKEKILDSIMTYVSNAEKVIDGNKFILDMKNAIYEKPKIIDNIVLKDQVFMLNILSNRAENLELIFNFSLIILKDIYFQMSYTNGRYVDNYSYSLSAISAGVGSIFNFNFGDFLFGINYGGKSLVVSPKKLFSQTLYASKLKSITYLELLFRSQLLNNYLVFSIGSKYYFSNISVLDVNTKFNFSLGIGIKFNAI